MAEDGQYIRPKHVADLNTKKKTVLCNKLVLIFYEDVKKIYGPVSVNGQWQNR